MSDKSSMLGGLGARLREGLSKMNTEAKDKAEGNIADSTASEQGNPNAQDPILDEVLEPTSASHDKERLVALDDELIDDGLIIEGEAQPQKPKPKGLDKLQKLLLIAVMVMGGIYWTQTQSPAPTPEDVSQGEAQQGAELQSASNNADEVPGPAFDLGSQQHPETPIETVTGEEHADQLGFGSTEGNVTDAANEPIGTDLLMADLNEQFSSMGDEGNEILDPFTGQVKPAPARAAALQVSADASKPQDSQPAPQDDAAAELAMLGESGDSPFGTADSNSTELGGSQSQNADSRSSELTDQSANADVATLNANIAEKDGRISKLETEVSKLKTDLALAKQETAKAKAGAHEPPASKAPQKQPAKPSSTAQRSAPTQLVASSPKAVARPQVCVTAVAQAARNCTTCVPHAFITHRGMEDIVGQGDFIEGLRVNIVGDRLDLQNAKGDVVHKFWSSPNGCAAG